MEPIKVSKRLRKIPIALEDDDGKIIDLEMREMTADNRDQYFDHWADHVKRDGTGKVTGLKTLNKFQADLLYRCLFRPDGTSPTADEIQKWPASTVSVLYFEARKLNRLDESKEEGEPKND